MLLRLTAIIVLSLFACNSAQADVFYFSDFEADPGGFVGTNDWEWGAATGAPGGFGSTSPSTGFSGANLWGTVLAGDHSPSTISILTQTFDFTLQTGVQLNFWEWSDSGGNTFDMASVRVNGTQEYLSNGDSVDAWRNINLDLSAYDGMGSVTIDFQFSTTSVVERTGWYLDDVRLSNSVPEPGSLAVIGFAGLALAIRRRR